MRNRNGPRAVGVAMIRSFILAAFLLGACQAQTSGGSNGAKAPAAPAGSGNADVADPNAPVASDDPSPPAQRGGSAARPPSGCPVARSSDWTAWVNAMPGPGARPKLIVTGKITVPTGGYRTEWSDMRVAESHPVQIFADLRVIPPSGPATQVVTTHDVRGEWPVDPPVGSVTVRCAGEVLARISPVETAH